MEGNNNVCETESGRGQLTEEAKAGAVRRLMRRQERSPGCTSGGRSLTPRGAQRLWRTLETMEEGSEALHDSSGFLRLHGPVLITGNMLELNTH